MSYRSGASNRIVVGISSRSSERDLKWLMDFIEWTFRDHMSEVKHLPISNYNRTEWEKNVRTCSAVILYHTKHQGRLNMTDVDGALYDDELKMLSETPGRSNVLVVLDDLENCSDTERQRILEAQPKLKRFSSDLLLFPEEGKYEEAMKKKEEFIKLLGIKAATRDPQPNSTKTKAAQSTTQNTRHVEPKTKKISRKISDYTTKFPSIEVAPVQSQSRLKIGIFSRSAESNYAWLLDWLNTHVTRPVDVRAVYIRNNASTFYSELSKCSFAILYHTKTQGRINITDVTDNLYDVELRDLSATLGQENVIVVIDDLEKTDSSERNRILGNQPSIGRLARGLFLFQEKKKNPENLEEIKRILMTKAPSFEVLGDDYRQDNDARKYKEPRTHTRFTDSAHSRDSSVDNDSSASWGQATEGRRNPDKSSAQETTQAGAGDSGGPEAERINLDPIGPTLRSSQADAEVGNTMQEATQYLNLSLETFSLAYMKWQKCQQVKEEESRDVEEQVRRIQRENEELKCEKRNLDTKIVQKADTEKQLLEALTKSMQEKEEKERIIERLRQDLRDNQVTTWKKEEEITELQKKLSDKEQLVMEEIRARNQTERDMEKLLQDLRHKDRIIEEDKDMVQNWREKMDELVRKVSDKEELVIKEIQARTQIQHTMETLKQDLRHKDKTIEENEITIWKMKEKIKQLENDKHRMETNPSQEQAGHASQLYEVRSPIPGQEADGTSSDQVVEKRDRTQRNPDALYNQGQRPSETPSLRGADEVIQELRRTIQKKDEEIQELKTMLEVHKTLINDILEESEGKRKKLKY
ncbi:uncharacterized protein ACNLHF_026507 isoform 1-T1 [Anomaloglossus baeobatrachus]|uniref:uncharacterized protein LOC142245712 isoform X1 n=1 Tax=Anomaloglossus baeobatrachus TaxID=238106 RepID=UPI003F4FE282